MELREQLSSCLFCAILLATIPFSESFEVISFPAVTGIIGQDVVLPCQISTGTQPDNMEVQWKKIIQTHIETVYEYRAQTGQDVPGQKYQGRTVLLKNGFTSGNVSLKLKNVQPADRGIYICIVKSNEWSDAAATKLKISEFKNGETLRNKGKKRVRFSLRETPEKSKEFENVETLKEKEKKRERRRSFPPEIFENNTETFEENTEFENGETLKEKEKKRERRRRSFPPEIFENNTETSEDNTEKMVTANLALQIIEIIIIGIGFIKYHSRKRRRDPERGRLISAEEDELRAQLRIIQTEKDELQREVDELQAQLRIIRREKGRIQAEKDELQREVDELQGELNWRRAHTYADDITLNPDTAHPNLSISWDKKSLKHEAQPQNVPPAPERFDSTVCVLGSEEFSIGKHYWEVDVRSSTDWDLGVARKSIKRKGKLSLSSKEGFWVLGLSGRDYWAKTDPWTRVMVQKKPQKIGVYVSYREGWVTFLNVTDRSVLFTFNDCSFSGEVCPFFKNSHKETSMKICSISEDKLA